MEDEVKKMRDAMVAARTREALESATGDYSTALFVKKPSPEARAEFQQRRTSSGGHMYARDLDSAVFSTKKRVTTRASVTSPFALDFDCFSRTLTRPQLVKFFKKLMVSFAVPYVRAAQDLGELKAAKGGGKGRRPGC